MNKHFKFLIIILAIAIYTVGIRQLLHVYVSTRDTNNADMTQKHVSQVKTEEKHSNSKVQSEDSIQYRGEGVGYKGKLNVDVTFSNEKITEIKIVDCVDDVDWVIDVETNLLPKIIEHQDANIDVVAGATYTSNGVLNAVKDAITQYEEVAK